MTPEEKAKEYGIGPSSSPSDWKYIQKYFLDGYHSRDQEVEMLVDILSELVKIDDDCNVYEAYCTIESTNACLTDEFSGAISKAKEALKQYQQ